MQHDLITLPSPVSFLMNRLYRAGFSAYAVGGCVRDSLLGQAPHDWDICTFALPEQIQHVFADQRLVTTGLKHGTVTVVLDHIPFEITTFRVDGSYSDHRHPDGVIFVRDVREDLARRDFTINAMAFSSSGGLVDAFEGQRDLDRHIIRCVGDPSLRFEEDALRILRALRFASVYDFTVDPLTDEALRRLAPTLRRVAAERIREEFIKLLCGPGAGRILRSYPRVIAEFLPEISPMIGYDQNNHHHLYDLWEHTVRAVENIPPDPVLRVTMLLHDTGKPAVRVTDSQGESHYPGHQEPVKFKTVVEGDLIDLGGFVLKVYDFHGHTLGLTALYEEEKGLLFCGDHILAKITPNITFWKLEFDALGQYLHNLRRARDLNVKHVFSAHRHQIPDANARIDELLAHHAARLEEVERILARDGRRTVYQVAEEMHWDYGGGDFRKFPVGQKQFAAGEAFAHLEYFYFRGKVLRTLQDGVFYYELPAGK